MRAFSTSAADRDASAEDKNAAGDAKRSTASVAAPVAWRFSVNEGAPRGRSEFPNRCDLYDWTDHVDARHVGPNLPLEPNPQTLLLKVRWQSVRGIVGRAVIPPNRPEAPFEGVVVDGPIDADRVVIWTHPAAGGDGHGQSNE